MCTNVQEAVVYVLFLRTYIMLAVMLGQQCELETDCKKLTLKK